tara:strand:+ start:35353 stop:35526 length:174 start_codon:yes stop_codon:yes gene_type:complete
MDPEMVLAAEDTAPAVSVTTPRTDPVAVRRVAIVCTPSCIDGVIAAKRKDDDALMIQ